MISEPLNTLFLKQTKYVRKKISCSSFLLPRIKSRDVKHDCLHTVVNLGWIQLLITSFMYSRLMTTKVLDGGQHTELRRMLETPSQTQKTEEQETNVVKNLDFTNI